MSESLAEEFLIERGLVSKRSASRRQILSCMGCRWLTAESSGKTPEVYATEIQKCRGMQSGVVSASLVKLAEVGIMASRIEDVDRSVVARRERRYYSPAPTALGAAFRSQMVQPDVCSLEEAAEPEQSRGGEKAAALLTQAITARRASMTQAEMAAVLGVSEARVSAIERTATPGGTTLGVYLDYADAAGLEVVVRPRQIETP